MYEFVIDGHIVPCTRVTTNSKWSPRATRYHSSQEAMRWQLRHQMLDHQWEMLPDNMPLGLDVEIKLNKAVQRADLDNLIKAVSDSAQGVVFINDKWINKITAVRCAADIERATIRIYVLDKENKLCGQN